ncbi:MAG: protein O-mannosyl-transferase family [Anaerolineae bacterium]
MVKTFALPKTDRLLAAGLAAVSLGVYAATLAPTVLFADGGEFQFVPWLPGIAHPTGYPLYTLLGWLFGHLIPFGEVAWRMNLFSAVAGAAAVGIVYTVARQLTTRLFADAPPAAHRLSAAAAALVFAFGRTFWSQVIIAEVYGLHALFVALALWACLRIPPRPERSALTFKEGGAAAIVLGLGLTHHRTITLMVPAMLLYVWLAGRRRVSVVEGLKLALAVGLPGLLYAYLPLAAPFVPYAQLTLAPNQTLTLYANNAAGFLAHVFGSVFSPAVQPGGFGADRFALALRLLRQQTGWAGAVFGLAGLFSLKRHLPALALTLASFAGFLIFNLSYFIGDIEVLFIPCWLILSLWIGVGLLGVAGVAGRTLVRRKRARQTDIPLFARAGRRLEARLATLLLVGLAGLGLLFPATLLVTRRAEVSQRHNTVARQAWLDILLQDLPPNAVLLSNDRNEMMPLWYYQYVQHRRPDLLGLFPLITPDPNVANVGRLLEQALASGRPVYFIKPVPGLEIKADLTPLPLLPHAQLVQAARPNLTPSHHKPMPFGDNLTLAGYDLLQSEDELSVTLYWQVGEAPPGKNYASYVHLLNAQGVGVGQSDHMPGGVFYPSGLWSPAETLRDRHTLPLSPTLPPGEYTLVAGLYFQPEPGVIQNLGSRQVLTTVTIF